MRVYARLRIKDDGEKTVLLVGDYIKYDSVLISASEAKRLYASLGKAIAKLEGR